MNCIRHLTLTVASCAALGGAVVPAHAAEEGMYVGVMGGRTMSDVSKRELDAYLVAQNPGFTGTSKLSDSATTWSFVWGYRFNPYMALEGSYISLGTVKYRASGPADVDIDLSAKGPAISAMGIWPVTDAIDVYGRFGVLLADSKFTYKINDSFDNGADSTAHSRDTFYGVGAAYHYGSRWTFRFDWQHFVNVGDAENTGEADADTVTLGVMFHN